MTRKEAREPSAQSIFFSNFRLDLVNEQLWRGAQLLAIRPKTFAVLRYLVEHSGRLVTRDELCQAVWPETVGSERAPKQCIRELRQVLGEEMATPRFIETIARRGWRFIALLATTPPYVQGSKFKVPSSDTRDSALRTQYSVLVGRERELTQLHGWLDKALNGERQMVFVTGEPGIGKTTLVDSFLQSLESRVQGLASEDPTALLSPARTLDARHPTLDGRLWLGRGQCIEQYGPGEPYMPILEALERLGREPDGKRLIVLLQQHAPTWLAQMPALLSAPELEGLQRQTQGATRERMLREMGNAIDALTAERPLVLCLEDLHWSDASTIELLAFLARRKEPARLLVIGTYRPVEILSNGHVLQSLTQELYAHRLATEVPLGALSEAEIAACLAVRLQVPSPAEAGEPVLSGVEGGQDEGERAHVLRNLAPLLHHRTGGNPLFLVSTIDDLVAQGRLTQSDNSWAWQEEVTDVGIAESIRQLVAGQSGRLASEERATLEAASVAGMEFSAAAVAAALTTETIAIERRCERLAERQQFLRRVGVEVWPDDTIAARYSFLHAVYQQLWHERVSPTQLQAYHLRIGERKERAYGERAREIATELALHFEQGRDYRKAVQYLQHTGENAVRRSAHQEAISLLTKGLELLKTLPHTQERIQQELKLQITLGSPLQDTKGYAAPEVEQTYARALALCHQIDRTPELFPVLQGLCAVYQERADFHTAYTLAEQLLSLAESRQASDHLLWAHYALGSTLYSLGKFVPAHIQLGKGFTFYDSHKHHFDGFGQNPGVSCLHQMASLLWLLGYPNRTLEHGYHALNLARKLSHPYSLSMALSATAGIHRFRREEQTARELEEERNTLADEQGFATWLTQGKFWWGWTLVEQGQGEEGVSQMQVGLSALRARGAELSRPSWLVLLAQAYGKVGQAEKGLQVLNEALRIIEKGGRRVYEAELYRLAGELSLRMGERETGRTGEEKSAHSPIYPFAHSSPEVCFLKAIDIARKQEAKSWELRAATSLARLWQSQGKEKKAHKMLSAIYNWFTEGFDTRDLQEAKALLTELS